MLMIMYRLDGDHEYLFIEENSYFHLRDAYSMEFQHATMGNNNTIIDREHINIDETCISMYNMSFPGVNIFVKINGQDETFICNISGSVTILNALYDKRKKELFTKLCLFSKSKTFSDLNIKNITLKYHFSLINFTITVFFVIVFVI